MKRWYEQANTKYENLSEEDKEKDRKIARRLLEKITPIESSYIQRINELEEKAKVYDLLMEMPNTTVFYNGIYWVSHHLIMDEFDN